VKQVLGVLMLAFMAMASTRADARPVASMAACRQQCTAAHAGVIEGKYQRFAAYCDINVMSNHRFHRCFVRDLRSCRRSGLAAVCPLVPIQAAPTPTTTVPSPPQPTTTTTTLPPPPVVNLTGSYEFDGYVTSDPCGAYGLGTYISVPFAVTAESGTSLVGLQGNNDIPVTGSFTPATGGWNLGASWCVNDGSGCCDDTGIGVGADTGFAGGVGGVWFADTQCPTGSCSVEATGLVY
jgi:hypothetical protein